MTSHNDVSGDRRASPALAMLPVTSNLRPVASGGVRAELTAFPARYDGARPHETSAAIRPERAAAPITDQHHQCRLRRATPRLRHPRSGRAARGYATRNLKFNTQTELRLAFRFGPHGNPILPSLYQDGCRVSP